MGWSIGHCDKWNRDIGYGVVAYCDHPKCNEVIDRGLSYLCGDINKDGGCGLHFCEARRSHYLVRSEVTVCDPCKRGRQPYKQKQDHPDWIKWKLKHYSWKRWREENPEEVLKIKTILYQMRELK